mmetsp:Transcript_10853/g.14109  ORF Transcript_10853/g.14109 Transcript_10853/m.14109 type:complete len:264 (-) Transcript_10853:211-1002(-)
MAKKKKKGAKKEKKISSRRQNQLQAEKELEEGLAKLRTIDEDGNDIPATIQKRTKYKRRTSSDSEEEEEAALRARGGPATRDFFHEDRKELAKLLNIQKKPHRRRCFICDRSDNGLGGQAWQKSEEMGVVFCPQCAQTGALQMPMTRVTKAFNRGYCDGNYTSDRFTDGKDFSLTPATRKMKEKLPEIKYDIQKNNNVQNWDTYWWQHKRRAGEAKKRDGEIKELAISISQPNSSLTNYKDKNYYHTPIIPEGKRGHVQLPKL